MRITFDSNVWRIVASPYAFPNDPEIATFLKINSALTAGKISAFVSETIFTLEAIKKTARQQILATQKSKCSCTESQLPDGTIKLSFTIGPDAGSHPGNNHYLNKHWTDAEKFGFKILGIPRIAGIQNPDLKHEWFVGITHEIANRLGDCDREIEANGCGISQIKQIGQQYAPANEPWHKGIALAPNSEEGSIAKAVAEWADGDTVAAHYAYGNDYICTRDIAKSGGPDSVFAPKNRIWLKQRFGVDFVTLVDLSTMI